MFWSDLGDVGRGDGMRGEEREGSCIPLKEEDWVYKSKSFCYD